jgi:hypothetical protein
MDAWSSPGRAFARHIVEGSLNLGPGERSASRFASGGKTPAKTKAFLVPSNDCVWLTIKRGFDHLGHTGRSRIQNNQSKRRKCTRLVRRSKTISCSRKATISSPKSSRDRIKLPSYMNTPQISPNMNPFL